MNYWNKIPLFRIILPFLMGIIIAFHFQLSAIYLCIIILATVVGVLSISYFKHYFSSFSKRWIFGLLINLLFVVFGVLITQQHKPINKRFHFEKYRYVYEKMLQQAKLFQMMEIMFLLKENPLLSI